MRNLLHGCLLSMALAATGAAAADPSWDELQGLLGRDIDSDQVRRVVAAHELSKAAKGDSGSFTPRHQGYSVMFREGRISSIILRVSGWPEGNGERHWRTFAGELPAKIRREEVRSDFIERFGESPTRKGDTWRADGLEIWVIFDRESGRIDELHVSRPKARPGPGSFVQPGADQGDTGAGSSPGGFAWFSEETRRAFALEAEADFVAGYSTEGRLDIGVGRTDRDANLHHPIEFTLDELEGFFEEQRHKGLIVVTIAKHVWTDEELAEHLVRLRDYFVARGYERIVIEQASATGRGIHLEHPAPGPAEPSDPAGSGEGARPSGSEPGE